MGGSSFAAASEGTETKCSLPPCPLWGICFEHCPALLEGAAEKGKAFAAPEQTDKQMAEVAL